MELKTMQDCLDDAARNNGYETFYDIYYELSFDKLNSLIKEAMKLYTQQIAEAACKGHKNAHIEAVKKCTPNDITNGFLRAWIIAYPQPDIDKLLK